MRDTLTALRRGWATQRQHLVLGAACIIVNGVAFVRLSMMTIETFRDWLAGQEVPTGDLLSAIAFVIVGTIVVVGGPVFVRNSLREARWRRTNSGHGTAPADRVL